MGVSAAVAAGHGSRALPISPVCLRSLVSVELCLADLPPSSSSSSSAPLCLLLLLRLPFAFASQICAQKPPSPSKMLVKNH
jgi:hypothetical protein